MLDKTIPYFNVLMRYDGPMIYKQPNTPNPYLCTGYRSGDEYRWAKMETDNNDFDSYENAIKYFDQKYLSNKSKLMQRFIGVRDTNDLLVGSVICWDDDKDGNIVSSVHWLITDPKLQRQGIGTFLMSMLIYRFSNLDLLPIYLHTQPWSYIAIGIYSHIGFKLLKTDSFRGYENQTKEALPVLKQYMPEKKYQKLITEMI